MISITDIKKEFENSGMEQWDALIQQHSADERAGVRKIIEKYTNRKQKYQEELERTEKMKELLCKFEPYLDEHHQLPDDVSDDVKDAYEEYIRLGKEQMDYAYSM